MMRVDRLMAVLPSALVSKLPANGHAAWHREDGSTSRPAVIAELNSLTRESVELHELNFQLHRRLLCSCGNDEAGRRLLYESSQIATRTIPHLTTDAQRLAARWERSVDPVEAREVATELAHTVETSKPAIWVALNRLLEIEQALDSLIAATID